MKILITEDDFTSRLLLQEILKYYGTSHVAVNGKEAVEAVRIAIETGEPYNLICLDIMMPEMDGQEALSIIRQMEASAGLTDINRAKIIMTTTLTDKENVINAAKNQCDIFLAKPVQKARLLEELRKMRLII
ncbi:MAG: response regulator [Proteobacteria bacterium]|nr:response regulator [Pseudomonadota bacterium]